MKFVDCIWEIENIGRRTCEITYDENETFEKELFVSKTRDFEYVVVKVPMNRPDLNIGMTEMGFTLIETQFDISKRFIDFNFEDRLVKRIYPHVTEQRIVSKEEFDNIMEKMTPNMFSTDRIYLDPHFDPECSYRRYANWMKKEFQNQTSLFTKIFYDEVDVGFGMFREIEGNIYGLLGGIYETVQSEGYGLLTSCIEFIIYHKNKQSFKKLFTAISSNNVPMVQIYNYLQFKVDKMTYVFVKHNS
jgi:hypothetical protein